MNAELREITDSHLTRESPVMISSTMPSAKYSCSESPVMFWNGSTAIEGLSDDADVGEASAPSRAAGDSDLRPTSRYPRPGTVTRWISPLFPASSAFLSAETCTWML